MIPERSSRVSLLAFVACVLLSVCPTALAAQDKDKDLVSLNVKEKTVGDVLEMIEASTGYIFFYNTADVDKRRKVTLECTDASLSSVLTQLFEGQDNSYKIDGRQVYITKKGAPNQQVSTNGSPTRLKGHVVDMNGEPLPGASATGFQVTPSPATI